jgi:hypothetical protein
MTDRWTIDELLSADPRDGGCRETFELLDRYAEAELAEHNGARRFPRVAAHLRGCAACHQVFMGLVTAVAESGPDDPR